MAAIFEGAEMIVADLAPGTRFKCSGREYLLVKHGLYNSTVKCLTNRDTNDDADLGMPMAQFSISKSSVVEKVL
jgi:hypothetical protein